MNIFDYVMAVFSHGVPGVIFSGLAMILVLMALIMELPSLMVLAALFTFPFTYTMGSWHGIMLAIRLLPLLQLASAFAISKKDMLIAWVCPILPFFALATYLLKVIAAQF